MVPIGTLFTRFRRAARNGQGYGKEVNLITSGEHTEIDTGGRAVGRSTWFIWSEMRYHGIEPRLLVNRINRPPAPSISTPLIRGNSVLIEVEDDGAGPISSTKAAVKLGW